MSLLLDTSVLLMAALGPSRLPKRVVEVIRTYPGDIYASVVSLWEIGLKASLGKLELPYESGRLFDLCVQQMELIPLDLDRRAASESEHLPLLHRDPFDRMLIAQTKSLGAVLITNDDQIARYPVRTLWA